MTPRDGVPQISEATTRTSSTPAGGAFPIVGVGSSAGGLSGLTSFLSKLPGDTGMAFVLIQHLDPTHESQLPSLLARSTRIPIIPAADGLRVEPDRIYIITPNTSLSLAGGSLRITPRESAPRPHLSIDFFLQSLAKERPGRAIGVILSGTGTDGTLGLAAIKAAGGITFAQDHTAEHQAMPLNAISHGCVDFILPPDEISQEIEKISVHGFPARAAVPSSIEAGDQDGLDDIPVLPEDGEHIAAIIEAVRTGAGIDFRHYQPTTIKRRIIRRLGVLQLPTLANYARFLDGHPDEIAALVKDLRINVTSFFRDHDAFSALTTVIFPALLKDRRATDPIRIWVAGCSTGQEVYSIAMELLEYLEGVPSSQQIQIFGSDISEWALTKARAGYYPESAMADVPAERISCYFTKEPLGYRIKKAVRDRCVFAKHDVTVDTPFSKLDLISCRNVLIYLAPVLQMKVFHTFHFSMKTSGFLLLGSAESLGRSGDLFGVVDEKLRIFHRKGTARRAGPAMTHAKRPDAPIMIPPGQPSMPNDTDMQRAADRMILGRFAPAGVLIDDSLDIIQFRGQTRPFLEPAQGEASLNLLTMVPYGVADALKAAIAEAKEKKVPVRRHHVALRRGDHFREIGFEVIPILMSSSSVGSMLILFSEQDEPQPEPTRQAVATRPNQVGLSVEARQNLHLRSELIAANDHIQSITEQCRTVTEQLRTAQEEASSTTEEFRSTNEELQTAKEEVDAANEELVTVNEELRNSNQALAKTMELTTAIVETMRYPLLVLDADLNVESANQAFLKAFRVSAEHTLGRRIYQLGNGQWDIPELRRLLEDIMPNDSAFDDFKVTHDFTDIGRRTILVNARRLETDHPQPRIVLVFADITDQNRIVRDLQAKSEELVRSNAELDQFAAVASHDLQEPLRMISVYITLIERRYAATFDDKAQEFMGFVTSGVERMSGMIKAILDYSKLGHQGSGFAAVDAEASFSAATANLQRAIDESKATVTHGRLPKVRSNAAQLTQLFQNLMSNALKFASGQRPAKIHVCAAESEAEWTFSVCDNGVGIAAEDHDRIFQLFQRLNSAHHVAGTGIGLATCRKIVGHHGGRIWVESTVDVGTTFHFSIPK